MSQRQKISTTEQKSKVKKSSRNTEENIPFQKRKIIREIFVVITIIDITPVKKFEVMNHFQKTQYTFPQILHFTF